MALLATIALFSIVNSPINLFGAFLRAVITKWCMFPWNEIDSMNLDPAEEILCRICHFPQGSPAPIPSYRAFESAFFSSFRYIRFDRWSEIGPMGSAGNLNIFPSENLL